MVEMEQVEASHGTFSRPILMRWYMQMHGPSQPAFASDLCTGYMTDVTGEIFLFPGLGAARTRNEKPRNKRQAGRDTPIWPKKLV
jgi:hypothetical protein